jgi:hypothetical protein
MGILTQLEKQGSTLSKLNGQTPPKSSGVTPLDPKSLAKSQLDLNGLTPDKYLDNLPR